MPLMSEVKQTGKRGERIGTFLSWMLAVLACLWVAWCCAIGPLYWFGDGLSDFGWLNVLYLVVAFAIKVAEVDPQREATRAMEEMRPVCWTLGKPCEAHFVDGTTLRGTALELNPDASLTIRDDNGNLHTVRTADVGVLPQ